MEKKVNNDYNNRKVGGRTKQKFHQRKNKTESEQNNRAIERDTFVESDKK